MPKNLNKNLEQKGYTKCVTLKIVTLPSPLTPRLYTLALNPAPSPQKNPIWILCQNSLTRELKIRVVEFVLKKFLTYFEMLIVPHALQFVDDCFFCILLLAYYYCFSTPPPPSPTPPPTTTTKQKTDSISLSKFTY